MKQYSPTHPGIILREFYVKPNEWTITMLAEEIGITRPNLSKIVNGSAGISAKMALKLSEVFGTTAEYWLTLQMNYDLWKANK